MTRVAIQGICGSYSEEAARRLLGASVHFIECRDFAHAFRSAETAGTLAVIPVKNSIAGTIAVTDGMLKASGLRVRDEVVLRIDHVLAGVPGSRLAEIDVVRSHTEALKQCGKFLDANPQMRAEAGADTASSIRETVTAGIRSVAAIGSRRAVELYGAIVLREGVADSADNRTTFYLVGK